MSSSTRYHAFDSLRAFAMLLGIFFHAAAAYVDPIDAEWAVNDASRHVGMNLFTWASHAFRMQVFFLMSSFFAHLLYQRYGPWRFMLHRLKRIALPFAVGLFTLVPVTMGVWLWSQDQGLTNAINAHVPGGDELPVTFSMFLQNMVPAHLWFLEYLMIFCLGAYVIVPLLAAVRIDREPFDRLFRWLAKTPWNALLLALPAALAMGWQGGWGAPGGPGSFVPVPRTVAYFGIFFAFGWLLYRHVDLLDSMTLHWRRYLVLALPLLLTPALLLVRDRVDVADLAAYRSLVLGLSAVYTWLMVFGLMGLFLRLFRRENARIRYVSDSAYWLYLAHIPLVPFLHVIAAQVSAPLLVKYFAVNAVALTVLFLSYEYLVRYTWLGAMLNGRRHRQPSRAQQELPALGS
jgi:glucan biosynthesis protein C